MFAFSCIFVRFHHLALTPLFSYGAKKRDFLVFFGGSYSVVVPCPLSILAPQFFLLVTDRSSPIFLTRPTIALFVSTFLETLIAALQPFSRAPRNIAGTSSRIAPHFSQRDLEADCVSPIHSNGAHTRLIALQFSRREPKADCFLQSSRAWQFLTERSAFVSERPRADCLSPMFSTGHISTDGSSPTYVLMRFATSKAHHH